MTLPPSGTIKDNVHHFPVRVYYEDTDAGGVVYHANYLKYAERARTEFMRLIEDGQSGVREKYGILFAVARQEIDFIKPARLDDALTVKTSFQKLRGASLMARQEIFLDTVKLVDMVVKLVVIDQKMKPAKWPPALRQKLEEYVAHG